jgi:GT2 family glycosyltransferase
MSSLSPTFSFIIVNYRSAANLLDWFASLYRITLLPSEYEVIIVNNDLRERAALDALVSHHHFTLIHAENNLGFGRACNMAAQNASGDVLGFLNPDTRFTDGNIRLVRNCFREDPSLGALGLRLIDDRFRQQAWSAGCDRDFLDTMRNHLGTPRSQALWKSREPIHVDWVSGAALFVPAATFREARGFDEDFFLYFEDIDFCHRLRANGKKILYFPALSVKHLGGRSASSKASRKEHYYRSQDLFFAKHRPKWEGFAIKLLRSLFV